MTADYITLEAGSDKGRKRNVGQREFLSNSPENEN